MKGPVEPIAIVGMGCRFPGGVASPAAYWRLLRDGVDAIDELPKTRLRLDTLYDPRPATPGRVITRWGGLVEGVELFDAAFFELSPREAAWLDPQQRLLLETTWEALEAAGQVPSRLRGSSTGVFIGLWLNEYEMRMFRDTAAIDFYMTTGTGRYAASGRLSHVFGWNGPSVTLDCACSSSLVAVHLACQSLRAGECDLAVAGGANVILEPSITIAYSQSRMMAPDGRCKFGDARANGYVRSDGAGVVLLKRLADAVAAGDPIEAVIAGSAVNNDGGSSGSFGTPGRRGQEDLLRRAYESAGTPGADVWYVEAHGTGTRAGDPVELQALAAVLGQGRETDRPLVVGSVKTNIGHTEGAAGVAGLIKAALTVKHGIVPRSLHLQTPNPDIPWESLPVVVPREEIPWPGGDRTPVAGVSSFGIAGTNAHVVVRAHAPQAEPRSLTPSNGTPAESPVLVPLSAASPEALSALARTWLQQAAADGFAGASLADIAYSAGARRSHLDGRLALAASSLAELRTGLEAFLAGEQRRGISVGRRASEGSGGLVFVFSGQGSQWLGMGRELLEREPVFRASFEACDRALRSMAGWSLLDELMARPEASRLDDGVVVQPLLFAMHVSLAELWRDWGVIPSAVVGHSVGEIAAARVAGALTLEEAVRVVWRRSELMRRARGKGGMVLAELSIEAAQEAIRPFGGRLVVAVSNSSRSTVVSGDADAIDEILAELERREVFARRVKIDVASHSHHMEPMVDELRAALADLRPAAGTIPLYSAVTGAPLAGGELGAAYWVRNMREPVLFANAVRALHRAGQRFFLEVSPHPVLTAAIQQELELLGSTAAVLGSLVRNEGERTSMLNALGSLYVRGLDVDWRRQHQKGGRLVALPAYPWQRERLWYEGVAWDASPAPTAHARPEAESRQAASIDGALYEIVWREAPATPGPASTDRRSWLLLADRKGVADALGASLTAAGGEVVRVEAASRFESVEAWQELAQASWGGDWSRCAGVIHLWSLDTPGFGRDARESSRDVSARDCLGVVALARTLAGIDGAGAPRLYLVTAGAQAVMSLGEVTSPESGLLWGLGRVVGAEQPQTRCTNVDLGAAAGPDDVAALAAVLAANGPGNQIALRNGRRYEPRLLAHGAAADAEISRRPLWRSARRAGADSYRAVVRRPGSVDGLTLEPLRRSKPGPGQVEVAVVAAGLNFMNVLSVLGAYPGHPQGVGPLGGDCAGRIVAVGDGVVGLNVGDAVMGVALDGLATHVVTDARLVTPIPDGLDFEQAATIPIAFLTAYYALESQAHLREGERILIHAATGGVGLAALQLARWRGAKVIASAGSPAKREWLQSLGVRTVVDSRSVAFKDAVLEATGGRGVDLVLNSLAGEFVERGLDVLAPGGRFIELGKRDIHEGRALDRGIFRKSLAFFAIDLELLIREQPDRIGALLAEVRKLVAGGVLRPLPLESFPASRAAEAIRKMAEARHIGKLVVRLDDAEAVLDSPGLDRKRLGDGTCLITGGLGALGLATARWLVEQGLRSVALVSRRRPDEHAQREITDLEAAGATVRVFSADVSDRVAVEQLLATIDREMQPLSGVVHAAGVLDDATLMTVTPPQFERVLAGKVGGAVHLHELTADRSIDFFVLYSSITPLIGSRGQANYVAANAFLDALAVFRRGRGLPATSINWGPWADAGLAAADEKRGTRLAESGLPGLETSTALALLDRILTEMPTHAVAARVDWARFREMSLPVARWPIFDDVARTDDGAASPEEPVRKMALRAQPGRQRVAALEDHVRALVARVLRQDAARIDVGKPFRTLGLDSLLGLELRTRLESSFEVRVPATLVWNYPNVSALARELARRAEIPLDEPAPPVAPAQPAPALPVEAESTATAASLEEMLAQLEQLTDEEARRRLVEDVEERR